jgi:hypothetical protein
MCKILHLDIETAPMLGDVWRLWDTSVASNQLRKDWYIMSFAYKWDGSDEKVKCLALPDYAHTYKHHPEKDKLLLVELHGLLNEADIVVAHNGDKFDIKKINTRLILNGLAPPAPYLTVDTLKVCKKHFAFSHNNLDSVAKNFGLKGKLKKRKYQGHELWSECIRGNAEAWAEMKAYNEQDVEILEGVYHKLLPWISNHPSVVLHKDEAAKPACPKCGSEEVHWRGYYNTKISRYHRFKCLSCGGWGRGRSMALSKEHREAVLANAG